MGAVVPGERPDPPADLSPDERTLWDQLTFNLTAERLVPANVILLRLLITHLRFARALAGWIEKLEASEQREDPKVQKRIREMLCSPGQETARAASLFTKLRLTPQSRERKEDPRLVPSAYPRPWQDWGGRGSN